MNTRKLAIFILCAFLPMVGIGVIMHLLGGSPAALSTEALTENPTQAIVGVILSAGAMLLPMFAVIITQLASKEPVLKGLDISFKINRWWFIGWLLMPVIAIAVLGMTLLMPGAVWSPDNEIIQTALDSMPDGIGIKFIAASFLNFFLRKYIPPGSFFKKNVVYIDRGPLFTFLSSFFSK